MRSLVRVLFLALGVFALATGLSAVQPGAKVQRSPYASVLSVAGVEEAYAAKHPPLGPGCQRACSTTGCVWVPNLPGSCYVVSAEGCTEEPCQ